MSLLSGFGKLGAAVIRTAVCVPVAVGRDVLTLGGVLVDDQSATTRQLRKVGEEFQDGLADLGGE
jgi:hypothetical protein